MNGFANWMRFSVRLPRRLALPVGRLDAESEVLVLGKASRKLEIVALTLHPLQMPLYAHTIACQRHKSIRITRMSNFNRKLIAHIKHNKLENLYDIKYRLLEKILSLNNNLSQSSHVLGDCTYLIPFILIQAIISNISTHFISSIAHCCF